MTKRFLAECEREQLHLSGHVQAHGALVVADPALRVTHRSVNLNRFVDLGEVAPGEPLPPSLALLCDPLGPEPGARLQLPAALGGPSGTLDLVISRGNGGDILLEMSVSHDWAHPESTGASIKSQGVPADHHGLNASQQTLVERVARLSGFGRVMFYRFLDDGDGEVTAEARDPAVYGSYLGLRFPASDIPRIARDLYLQNPWRLIVDAMAEPVPIEGLAATVPDLGRSDLRSVSPVHLVYLANMGVRASLSFPVVVAGTLHGLVACHHHQPVSPALELLSQLAQEIRSHGLILTTFMAQSRMQLVDGLVRRFTAARAIVERAEDMFEAWPSLAPLLVAEFAADGAHLVLDGREAAWGLCLEPEALAAVEAWFGDNLSEPLWYSDSISVSVAGLPMSRIAGVLAIKGRTHSGRPLRAYLTRQEHIHEIAWGGNPEKPVEYHDGTHGISPRRSFEKWIETRFGRSRPWDNETRLLGLKLREVLLDVADPR